MDDTPGQRALPRHQLRLIRRGGPAPEPEGALPRRKLVFFIVSMALFMASVDQTIVATALPAIQHELHAQINWSGWTITIYALGQVLAMPMAGKISDMYGRKKVFLVSAVVFTASSLACGFAGDIYLLVGAAHGPGAGRRRVHALGDRHRRRPLRQPARQGHRHVHQHPADRRHRRPDHRRRVRRFLVVARHLPGQRADRDRADRAGDQVRAGQRAAHHRPHRRAAVSPARRADPRRHVRHHLPGQRPDSALRPGFPRLRTRRGRHAVPVRAAHQAGTPTRSSQSGCCAGAVSA